MEQPHGAWHPGTARARRVCGGLAGGPPRKGLRRGPRGRGDARFFAGGGGGLAGAPACARLVPRRGLHLAHGSGPVPRRARASDSASAARSWPAGRLSMPLIRNFGRNIEFRPQLVCQPADRAELLWRLEQHRARHLRCRGALHSWSSVIETDGVLFDLRGFRWVQVIGGAQPCVLVGAGCTLKRLLCELRAQGLTLPTLGAIKAQTVAGAVATGTHGSGKPSLSHFVEKVTLAHFDAADTVQVATIDSGHELLAAP